MHYRLRPYECNVCNKRWSTSADRHRHSMIHHRQQTNDGGTNRQFVCIACNGTDRIFANRNSLRKHQRLKHFNFD